MDSHDFNEMSWQDKLDRLELLADPELMPLIIAIRIDEELAWAAAKYYRAALEEAKGKLEAILATRGTLA